MKKNVLVSGSNGFIGLKLCNKLKQRYNVYGLSRELFLDFDKLQKFVQDIQPEYIYHLAAYGNHYNQRDIDTTITANYFYLYLLLKASNTINYQAFVNFSTSSVLLPCQTFYSSTKFAGEKLCQAFYQQFGKPIVSVRPYSVYGEGEADFRFIPTVCRSLVNGVAMPIDPDPVHDWVYIQDLLSALNKIVKNIDKSKGKEVEIGTGKQTSNIDVVKLLNKISKKELIIDVFSNMRNYDSTTWVANIYHLKSLGWKPKYILEQGLKKTYEHYKQRFKKKNN